MRKYAHYYQHGLYKCTECVDTQNNSCVCGCPEVFSTLSPAEAEAYVDLIILNSSGLDGLFLLSHHQIEKSNYSTQPMVYF